MSFSLFNYYFCQQSSRMFGFDSEKKNFFQDNKTHRETSDDSLLHDYESSKISCIKLRKNDDFINEGIANTTKNMPKLNLCKF